MARVLIRPGDQLDRGDPGLYVVTAVKGDVVSVVWKRRRRRAVEFEVDADKWLWMVAEAGRRKAGLPEREWDLGGDG